MAKTKHLFLFFFLLLFGLQTQAQVNRPEHLQAWRSGTQACMAPFYHGVASGDPTHESVLLWTRVTTDSVQVEVTWRVALDTGMTQMVDSGTVITDASKDYTVKVDVQGLNPNTFYFYEFQTDTRYSIRGRTKTFPVGSVDNIRLGVMSCSNYAEGFFNAYENLANRNDVDAVLHLGDYIYEYGDGQFGARRELLPPTEILSLQDYRMRHSHYKLDEDLMRLHQIYPFISVWDDHETANDAWFGGAQNHSPATEGDWFDRKSAGIRAYFEWMPIRRPDPQDTSRIYRRFRIGDLAELHMLDTRLEGREEQTSSQDSNPARTLLGQTQFDWLVSGMDTSTAQWQILGQQVMMAPLQIRLASFLPTFFPNLDQWDGYPAERARLYDSVITKGIPNMVVLTGDIHTSWANDLPLAGYNASTGANSAGVEFVTTSVTSQSSPLSVGTSIIRNLNPHIKFVELASKGYVVLDVNAQRTQADWFFLDNITQAISGERWGGGWQVTSGQRHLTTASAAAQINPARQGVVPPRDPRFCPDTTQQDTTILVNFNLGTRESALLGVYPNPVQELLTIQYSLHQAAEVRLFLYDLQGRELMRRELGLLEPGMQYDQMYLAGLASGQYLFVIDMGDKRQQRLLIKR